MIRSLNRPSTQQNQLDSPLLRLPAELRNRIYKFAFTGQSVTVLPDRRTDARKDLGTLALLLTSCQVHHETACLFWSHTVFDTTLFTAIPSESLALLGVETRSRIQSIKIHGSLVAYVYPYINLGGKTFPSFLAPPSIGLPSIQHLVISYTEYWWSEITKSSFKKAMRIWFDNPDIEVEYRYDLNPATSVNI
jgi:hypothetical protein